MRLIIPDSCECIKPNNAFPVLCVCVLCRLEIWGNSKFFRLRKVLLCFKLAYAPKHLIHTRLSVTSPGRELVGVEFPEFPSKTNDSTITVFLTIHIPIIQSKEIKMNRLQIFASHLQNGDRVQSISQWWAFQTRIYLLIVFSHSAPSWPMTLSSRAWPFIADLLCRVDLATHKPLLIKMNIHLQQCTCCHWHSIY